MGRLIWEGHRGPLGEEGPTRCHVNERHLPPPSYAAERVERRDHDSPCE